MREVNEENIEQVLASQVDALDASKTNTSNVPEQAQQEADENPASQYLGTKLTHKIGGYGETDREADERLVEEKKLTRIGEKIGQNAEIRDGWMEVDRRLLGDRDVFYPEDWKFRIRPATVELVRNWSTIDDENPNSVDDVFNEVLKSSLSILTSQGPIPVTNIRSWDRFFFVLLIREYTFINGEKKVEINEECPECNNNVTFTLSSQTLLYDMPDKEVMKHFSREQQNWMIDPADYDVDWPETIVLYLPTIEKDANIKAWMIDKIQNKKNIDNVFIKFLPWLAPKISKDLTIAQRQIREYEIKFKSWDVEMFSFMDEIINNITVVPSTKLVTNCPTCGEEVTTTISFQDGIRSLFNMAGGHKKFGKK